MPCLSRKAFSREQFFLCLSPAFGKAQELDLAQYEGPDNNMKRVASA